MSDHAIDLFVNGVVGGFLGGAIINCCFLFYLKNSYAKYIEAKKEIERLGDKSLDNEME